MFKLLEMILESSVFFISIQPNVLEEWYVQTSLKSRRQRDNLRNGITRVILAHCDHLYIKTHEYLQLITVEEPNFVHDMISFCWISCKHSNKSIMVDSGGRSFQVLIGSFKGTVRLLWVYWSLNWEKPCVSAEKESNYTKKDFFPSKSDYEPLLHIVIKYRKNIGSKKKKEITL